MSEPFVYLAAAEVKMFEWLEHQMGKIGYPTYNPSTFHPVITSENGRERFEIDMHYLAAHVDAVVALPDFYEAQATHGTVLLARALNVPVWILEEHPDPNVAFVLQEIGAWENEQDDADLRASMARHPAGKGLAADCVNDDAKDRPEPEPVVSVIGYNPEDGSPILGAPAGTAREVFEKAFGQWVSESGGQIFAIPGDAQVGHLHSVHIDGGHVDMVNHPPHYKDAGECSACGAAIEVIQITEGMGFCLGNAVKYILRADHKGNRLEDLRKAAWYINREIEKAERS